jgi:hypothetical protein
MTSRHDFRLLGHRVSVELARGFLYGVLASLVVSVFAIILAVI